MTKTPQKPWKPLRKAEWGSRLYQNVSLVQNLLLSLHGLPVLRANVASVIRWNAANVDDDSKDDEASASADLDETDDEFDLLRLVAVQALRLLVIRTSP